MMQKSLILWSKFAKFLGKIYQIFFSIAKYIIFLELIIIGGLLTYQHWHTLITILNQFFHTFLLFLEEIKTFLGNLFDSFQKYLNYKSNQDETFVSDLFMGMANATVGVLAIIFSISLFAAQQGYATYSQGALQIFLKDRVSSVIYIVITILAFCFYSLSISDKTEFVRMHIGICFILGMVSMLVVIVLIYVHYVRVTKIISPSYVVKYFARRAAQRLIAIHSETKSASRTSIGEITKEESDKLIRLGNIVPSLKISIEEISNVIKKYQDRKEYSIVGEGLSQIVNLAQIYIAFKKDLFIGGMSQLYMLPGIENLSRDNFFEDLDGVFEKLQDIANIASQKGDLETIRRVLQAIEIIAIKSLEIRYIGLHVDENHIFNVAIGYFNRIINESGKTIPDVSIQASHRLNEIIDQIFIKNKESIFMNAMKLSSSALAIASNGLKTDCHFLMNQALDNILRMIFYGYLRDSFPIQRHVEMFINKDVKSIIFAYLVGLESSSVDIEYAIGHAFGMHNFSLPKLVAHMCKAIAETTTDVQKRKFLIDGLFSLNKCLRGLYREILEVAGKNESGIILFIARDTDSIIRSLISLDQNTLTDSASKSHVANDISWYFSNYWRIYEQSVSISKNHYLFVEENILSLGVLFKELGYAELSKRVSTDILAIAKHHSEKDITKNEYTVPRMIVTALSYAFFSKNTDSFAQCLKALLVSKEITLTKEQIEILLSEYQKINQTDDGGGIRMAENTIKLGISDDDKKKFLPILSSLVIQESPVKKPKTKKVSKKEQTKKKKKK